MDSVSLVTGGLFFSWLAHDLEEVATMPGWTHPLFDKIPFLPEDIRRHGCSRGDRSHGRRHVCRLH